MPYRKPRYGKIETEILNEQNVSRKLTKILRHNAINQGINMRKDGFVKVTELVSPLKNIFGIFSVLASLPFLTSIPSIF